jgi:hypothetical protein
MTSAHDERLVTVVFADGRLLAAKVATVTQHELQCAALTDGAPTDHASAANGNENRAHSNTCFDETHAACVRAAIGVLFDQPRSSVTVISHVVAHNIIKVLHGLPAVDTALVSCAAARVIVGAVYHLPTVAFDRASSCLHECHHTIVLIRGDAQ